MEERSITTGIRNYYIVLLGAKQICMPHMQEMRGGGGGGGGKGDIDLF